MATLPLVDFFDVWFSKRIKQQLWWQTFFLGNIKIFLRNDWITASAWTIKIHIQRSTLLWCKDENNENPWPDTARMSFCLRVELLRIRREHKVVWRSNRVLSLYAAVKRSALWGMHTSLSRQSLIYSSLKKTPPQESLHKEPQRETCVIILQWALNDQVFWLSVSSPGLVLSSDSLEPLNEKNTTFCLNFPV